MSAAGQDAPAPREEPAPATGAAIGPARRLGVMEIAAAARTAVAFFTELPVDQVASCQRRGDGWVAVVDVIESKARLDDNDQIASFEVSLDAHGDLEGLSRTGRYRRADAAREEGR